MNVDKIGIQNDIDNRYKTWFFYRFLNIHKTT